MKKVIGIPFNLFAKKCVVCKHCAFNHLRVSHKCLVNNCTCRHNRYDIIGEYWNNKTSNIKATTINMETKKDMEKYDEV